MGIYIMATSIAPTVINPHVLKTKYNTTRRTIKNSLFYFIPRTILSLDGDINLFVYPYPIFVLVDTIMNLFL